MKHSNQTTKTNRVREPHVIRVREPHRVWENGLRIPVRTCVVCRHRRPQRELLRIARNTVDKSILSPDTNRSAPGRGMYICKDKSSCWSAKNLKRVARDGAEKLSQQLNTLLAAQLPGQQEH